MPQEIVTIGGKQFDVACAPGEEAYLRAAAAMLDAEATALIAQIGRVPEVRMLLMAGLMLADKTAGAEDRARALESELSAAQSEISLMRAASQSAPVAIPAAELSRLTVLAARAEALAEQIETH